MLNEVERNNVVLERSRLFCYMERNNEEMFFSLVDYRNNYFTSDDPNKIIEFYNSFESRDQLIQWMRERPKGVANIHEVDGDKDIIVVIPTADFNGKYAKECRDNIFKGLHMIFVESGGRGDFYFNIAHNVNIGIKKAMEYNPKWFVFSGDDVHAAQDIDVLKKQLLELDERKTDSVFLRPRSDYYSIPMSLSRIRSVRNLVYFVLRGYRNRQRIFEKKFNVKYVGVAKGKLLNRFFYKQGFQFMNFISFGIFSNKALRIMIDKYGYVFDDTFINNSEDGDMSVRLALDNKEKCFVNFKIITEKGGTLGWGGTRYYRDFLGSVYFSKKMEDYFE